MSSTVAATATTQCCVQLFGGLEVHYGFQTIRRFRTQKTGALLAYLAFYRDRTHPREALVEMLWPEANQQAGRLSLSVALSSLRSQLEPEGVPAHSLLLADRMNVGVSSLVITDVALFETALDHARVARDEVTEKDCLLRAVSLYRAELLPGYYEPWIVPQQERLAELFYGAARRLTDLHSAHGEFPEAIACARRLVSADPECEEDARTLIRLLFETGQAPAALRQYQELIRTFGGADELSRETQALIARFDTTTASATNASATAPSLSQPGTRGASSPSAKTSTKRGGTPATPPSDGKPPEHTPGKRNAMIPSEIPFASAFGGTLSPPQPISPLPLSLTRFFGRQKEMAQLRQILRSSDARLITLTGPGGIGKTRLALEAAREMQQESDFEVVFVSLVGEREAHRLPRRIRESLGLEEKPERGDPLASLVDAFTGRRVLLVLDNFEQIAEEGGAFLAELLARTPELTCLVTSRQRLPVVGEVMLAVAPLPTPLPPDEVESAEELAAGSQWDLAALFGTARNERGGEEYALSGFADTVTEEYDTVPARNNAAVDLFVDRARLARPDFRLTARNAAAVRELVVGLEGIPLAIEFAAARSQVLTPPQMLDQLKERFRFLVSHRRLVGGQQQHQSLYTALAWSYDLLTPEQQQFFRCLAVFQGGWTSEAAEAVAGPAILGTGKAHFLPFSLDLLAQLCDASLVAVEEGQDGSLRFAMLETVREFALQQLSPQEQADAEARHRRFYRALAEEAEPHLQGSDAIDWMNQLEREHGNFRAVLRRVTDRAENTTPEADALVDGLSFVASLQYFWLLRGHVREVRQATEIFDRLRRRTRGSRRTAMVQPNSGDKSQSLHRVAAKALNGAGIVAMSQGDYKSAVRFYRSCLWLRRCSGDRHGMAAALNNLAIVASRQDDSLRASHYFETSLSLLRAVGDAPNVARVLSNLGTLHLEGGRKRAAEEHFQEALALSRSLGDARNEAISLRNLGEVAYVNGDFVTARDLYRQSLPYFNDARDIRGTAAVLFNIGFVAYATGDRETAKQLIEIAGECYEELQAPFPKSTKDELASIHASLCSDEGLSSECQSGEPDLKQFPAWRSIPRLTSLTGSKALGKAVALASHLSLR